MCTYPLNDRLMELSFKLKLYDTDPETTRESSMEKYKGVGIL